MTRFFPSLVRGAMATVTRRGCTPETFRASQLSVARFAPSAVSGRPHRTVLHYLGSDDDRGGIVSIVRALVPYDAFRCVLGVNRGCRQERQPPLPTLELPRLKGESIGVQTWWRAR